MNKTHEMLKGTHKRWSEDDWELEQCHTCGLSGIHKLSCPERYATQEQGGKEVGECIAGDNCMCDELERTVCFDWKQRNYYP